MDVLAQILLVSQEYLSNDISLATYKLRLSRLALEMNDNEAKALADVISMNAIHLRGRGN